MHFIQFPDLKKNMHSIIDRIDLKDKSNKERSQPPHGQWLLGIALHKRYRNWPFAVLNIYKHSLHSHSNFHWAPASKHSLPFFQERSLLRRRKKKKYKKKISAKDWLPFTHRNRQEHWTQNILSAQIESQYFILPYNEQERELSPIFVPGDKYSHRIMINILAEDKTSPYLYRLVAKNS